MFAPSCFVLFTPSRFVLVLEVPRTLSIKFRRLARQPVVLRTTHLRSCIRLVPPFRVSVRVFKFFPLCVGTGQRMLRG